ncbi:MAG: undecaprenyldiphospho-muramoylpentapeptide beta-N-acetylglucosaminyltransferase [Gammaproteobacteria bacterium]|nr:undecaprenyldiphospho-muramoylpentapeptide beta-N-acetylglucosaminyltransferase [Gammaproteobacteria bacterium]
MASHLANSPVPRILIMAAGTGGHVYPALSTAENLVGQGWQVEWLGSGRGIETQLVPKAGYPLHCIDIQGLRGKSPWSLLWAPWRLSKSLWQAWRLIGRLQPDCVLGMGGFVAGPGGLAAVMRRKPLLIHEQNAIPGLTNRLLRPFSKRVMQAFAGAFTESQALTVGNPIRPEFVASASRPKAVTDTVNLLVIGGSLGALALNQLIPQALAKLPAQCVLQVRHQCGQKHLAVTQESYSKAGVCAQIDTYIDDMPGAFAWADLIICRAGALTVSELAAAGKVAILVPFPYAVDDHQTANANVLVKVGGGILLPQSQLTVDSLVDQLTPLITRPEQRQKMATAALKTAQPQATQQVALQCMEAING